MLIAMVRFVRRAHDPLPPELRILELALSDPCAVGGRSYYRRGWLGVVHGSPNHVTLIGLGVIVALLSV